jgi:hypothetical protein
MKMEWTLEKAEVLAAAKLYAIGFTFGEIVRALALPCSDWGLDHA